MKIKELKRQGYYIWRHKSVVFSGNPTPPTPARANDNLDSFDFVFANKQDFDVWYANLVAGLAELDQCLNYCAYFKRVQGNCGVYERGGKSYPVDGRWTGLHDIFGGMFINPFFDQEAIRGFRNWIIENGWKNDWFVLAPKYQTILEKNTVTPIKV